MTGPGLVLLLVLAGPARAAGIEAARASAAVPFTRPGLALPEAPAAVTGGSAVAEVVPPWMTVDDCGGCAEARDKVLAGLRLLDASPSGKVYGPLLGPGKARLHVYDGGSLMVSDGDSMVHAGPDFVNDKTDWQMAVFLSHELEHIHQRNIGLTGDHAVGVREMAALLKQSRVWVELGGKVRDEDWAANGANSQDMWAWLEYPYSTLTAMLLRTDKKADLSREDVRSYWQETLKTEAEWRKQWSSKFPKGRDSGKAALFILKQAGQFASQPGSGEVSNWLPQVLEQAAGLQSGKLLALPGEPSGKDRAILSVFPVDVRLAQEGGRWVLRRP
jgi:hypothetical protein